MPDREAGTGVKTKKKWVILLHGDHANPQSTDVAVIVASTWTTNAQVLAAHEVMAGGIDGFQHASIIDCRWPFTMLKRDVRRGSYKTTLDSPKMEEVSEALVIGLLLE